MCFIFFLFKATCDYETVTYLSTLSLHDALASSKRLFIQFLLGADVATMRLRNCPIFSISRTTSSPSARKRRFSSPHPKPTVPEPRISPACRVSSRLTCSIICSKDHVIVQIGRAHV